MNAKETLETAASLVGGDRARTHGDKTDNHRRIALLWQGYLDARRNPSAPLTPLDAAHMMALLKIARTQTGSDNPDDYIDLAGYAGVAAEIAFASRSDMQQRPQADDPVRE